MGDRRTDIPSYRDVWTNLKMKSMKFGKGGIKMCWSFSWKPQQDRTLVKLNKLQKMSHIQEKIVDFTQ